MRRMAWVMVAACAVAARAEAQQGISVAVGASMPIGALEQQAGTGLNLSLRQEGALPWAQLDYRVDIGLERFSGKGASSSLQYTSFSFNVVQWPSRSLYYFGGLGLYNSQTTRSTDRFGRSGSNAGVQGGVGYVYESSDYLPFVEMGLTNLFSGGDNAPWFSVRAGVHF
ncbi:MAG: hypothetical protein HYR75_06160 [Gemmatimonadetes bacterium]|nr:hypothetical protein [Gemmatimonadota bacterium]MBI3567371.1 hypothetical protein [Gemmatimonadota bacterium]